MLPRSLVVLALLIAASSALHSSEDVSENLNKPKIRKTLAFGFDKPHARFVTTPPTPLFFSPPSSKDPIEIAKPLIESLLPQSNSGEYGYKILKDSYTDSNTGVTHVYAKQLFRGIEVADGDVNVNVYKDAIISYGNEFYHPDNHDKRDQSQIPLVVPGAQDSPSQQQEDEEALSLPHLVLRFISLVTPSPALASSIGSNPHEHLDKIIEHPVHSLMGGDDGEGEGMKVVLSGVPEAVKDVEAKMVWAQTPWGLEPSWKINVEMEDNYYDAIISATKEGAVYSVVDWVSDSSLPYVAPPEAAKDKDKKPSDPEPTPEPGQPDAIYLVFPWGINDPEGGNRSLHTHSKFADSVASPYGWHTIPSTHVPPDLESLLPPPGKPKPKPRKNATLETFPTTFGNNVFAQENFAGRNEYLNNYRPVGTNSSSKGEMEFVFEYNPKNGNTSDERMMEARKHINATIVQLWFTSNGFHDLMYRYGFDEASGNFQQYNFGRGGKEDDAVIANAQDGSGFNNANFMTPPDGTSGRMRMYLWNTASPYRDGDFEAGIVIHELAHGMSTRLTGPAGDSSCLGFGESGGMGEGWGDFLATTIRSSANYSDFTMGSWAANNVKGIRNFPYSLNKTINPETYKSVDKYFGVHPIGEVWAEILWTVLQKLIKKHGFTESLFPPQPETPGGPVPLGDFYRPATSGSGIEGALIPKHGNSLMVQLVINGMKLQKCRPGFQDARDAIIQADSILTGGENFCEIWEGFAERGLGEDARVVGRTPWGGGIRDDGYAVPRICKPE